MKRIGFIILINFLMQTVSFSQTCKSSFYNKIDSLFYRIYPDSNEPGAAVLIKKGDSVLFEKCYGIADMQTMQPITPETNFCIASVSKQFSALAILKLAEQGFLKLSDNLHKFFPEYKSDIFDKITLAHILSHTSGIPDSRPRTNKNFMLYSTDIESCGYLKTLDSLNFEPGTKYEYINPTFQLIYQIIPRVTGVDFDTYIKNNFFDVAGMINSVFFAPDKQIQNMAHGYILDKDKKNYVECDYGEADFFATKADGGLYTSINDFAKWERALSNYQIVSEKTLEDAYSPKIKIPENAEYGYNKGTGYGYGFFVQQINGNSKCVYHIGDNGGFKIYAGKIPEKNIVLLFFSNRDDIKRIETANKIYDIIRNENWFE